MKKHRKGAPRLSGTLRAGKEIAKPEDISQTAKILDEQQGELDAKIGALLLNIEDTRKLLALSEKIQKYFKNAKPWVDIYHKSYDKLVDFSSKFDSYLEVKIQQKCVLMSSALNLKRIILLKIMTIMILYCVEIGKR